MSFRSAQSAKLDGVPDTEVLARAADDGRILVWHDFRTLPRHLQQFTDDRVSPGVLLVRQDLPVGDAIDTFLLVREVSEPNEWADRLCLVQSLVTIAIGRSVKVPNLSSLPL